MHLGEGQRELNYKLRPRPNSSMYGIFLLGLSVSRASVDLVYFVGTGYSVGLLSGGPLALLNDGWLSGWATGWVSVSAWVVFSPLTVRSRGVVEFAYWVFYFFVLLSYESTFVTLVSEFTA